MTSTIAALADREDVDIEAIAEALVAELPTLRETIGFDTLIDLGLRLPSGLIHAEGIWALSAPPPGVEALAPDSSWYAMERSLVVVLPPGEASISLFLRDLGRYFLVVEKISSRLADHPDLLTALFAEEWDPRWSTELAHVLEADPTRISALELQGLRSDVAWMSRQAFSPTIRIHAHLRPARLKVKALELVDQLVARIPSGSFRLAVSDTPMLLEPLSPYVRDLGHALVNWGLENADQITTVGLVEALSDTQSQGDPWLDLASLVIPDLFRIHGEELLEERRTAEVSGGLHLSGDATNAHGWADVRQLAAPDHDVVGRDSKGTIVIVSSPAPEVLVEATRQLLKTGRCSGLAFVLESTIPVTEVIIPSGITTEFDGLRLRSSSEVMERADKLSIRIHRAGCIEANGSCEGAPIHAAKLLGLARLARVQSMFVEDAPAFLVLYPGVFEGNLGHLSHRMSEISAVKLGLSTLLARPETVPAVSTKPPKQKGSPRIQRRFRA